MFHEPRFWTALAFVLFFVIFGRKIWAIVTSKLDDRADEVRKNLDEATRLRREAEQMLEDSRRDHKQAQEEAQALIAKSNAEAQQLRAQAESDAAEIVARHEKMARERIEAAEKIALRDIRREAAALALAATKDILGKKLAEDPDLANRLINDGLKALPQAFGDKAA
ncbi:F0F1 ATP synthase subunit B family protein [Bombella apis]|uniref:ATP synthase subunit b n=1 Tax=Bombella apis TaxID=1785988 RepID=A0ABR9MRX1_9PROT|nr:F0F1 ATP synthase subunit B [Bombella apis]MBE1724294.1 F0F1 ATP synthase subunit B [Bombella apis]MBR9729914.1 F0F1 ATP synthase subunit B [Bombella apis]